MYFILSKLLAFLVSPINWIAFLILFGLIARNRKRRYMFFATAIIAFFFFTNGYIADKAMDMLEVECIGRSELKEDFDVGILLGGMIHFQSDSSQVNFNSNGDRLFQTLDLYAAGRIKKILITSGSGYLQMPSFKEAHLIKKYMVHIGFPEEDILIETASRNTFENAVQTKKLLEAAYSHPESRKYLLITSASHMRRALNCFEKQGLEVHPYSTTKRSDKGRRMFTSEIILPDPNALFQWKVIGHELAGLLVYRIEGYI